MISVAFENSSCEIETFLNDPALIHLIFSLVYPCHPFPLACTFPIPHPFPSTVFPNHPYAFLPFQDLIIHAFSNYPYLSSFLFLSSLFLVCSFFPSYWCILSYVSASPFFQTVLHTFPWNSNSLFLLFSSFSFMYLTYSFSIALCLPSFRVT